MVYTCSHKIHLILKILHLPVLCAFTIAERPTPPWHNSEILAAKRARRAAERRWHRTGLHIHQEI